ncbi:hypothetical protein GCM10010277_05340 [Streptomyces longisporoflavus]|uniref:DUF1877 family protein n=1 Tax=Streptomyces longisporoflavus TaxID=28044 RepID=UPI00167E2FE3|nr:DUF1877 family protein [Streptomyces longisporoflavus]GGV24826.1 hypothetical protein GCM10010277_05340 [Streptomyces longisporoflavus]
MAVTQQLARVPAEYLAACRQSAGASPDGDHGWDPPEADTLDLDWAPNLLRRVCELADLDEAYTRALRQATDGDAAIDLAFLGIPPHDIAPFDATPTALSEARVARVADLLDQIDFPAILAGLPRNERKAARLIGHGASEIIGGPRAYLRPHFEALRVFYRGAAQRGLLVVLWWD